VTSGSHRSEARENFSCFFRLNSMRCKPGSHQMIVGLHICRKSGPSRSLRATLPGSGRQMADFDQRRHHPCVVAEWSRAFLYELRKAHESMGVTTQLMFSASTPRIDADYRPFLMGRPSNGFYDVNPDSYSFLSRPNFEYGPPDEVRIVLNWTGKLKQLAPARKQG